MKLVVGCAYFEFFHKGSFALMGFLAAQRAPLVDVPLLCPLALCTLVDLYAIFTNLNQCGLIL